MAKAPAAKPEDTVTTEPVAFDGIEPINPVIDKMNEEDEVPKGSVIVKVRLPENGIGPALASTEGMANYWYLEITPKLAKRMGEHKTQFFYAEDKTTGLKLGKYANWQTW